MCTHFICYRFVNVMVTTQDMTVVGVYSITTGQIVANHKLSPGDQLLRTLIKTGEGSLKFFDCYVQVILVIWLFWMNLFLVPQSCQCQKLPFLNCMYGCTITLLETLLFLKVASYILQLMLSNNIYVRYTSMLNALPRLKC